MPMITARYDEATGIVWTKASGLATVEEFDVYVPIVTKMLALSRARHCGYLHLIDAADNPVQAKGAFEHMNHAVEGAVTSEDRLALVMGSALARMQAKRMSYEQHFFEDCPTAEAWLLAQTCATEADVRHPGA
jgi:hypothetical protein